MRGSSPMRLGSARWTRRALAGFVAALALAGMSPAAAETLSRLYIVAGKAIIIDLNVPASKVAVANPGVADVQVITPAQLLVIGRGAGVTSLAVFSGKSVQTYDLVVYPPPVGAVAVGPVSGAPHAVLVQKADKITEHYFVRDVDRSWVELGSAQGEAEAPKR